MDFTTSSGQELRSIEWVKKLRQLSSILTSKCGKNTLEVEINNDLDNLLIKTVECQGLYNLYEMEKTTTVSTTTEMSTTTSVEMCNVVSLKDSDNTLPSNSSDFYASNAKSKLYRRVTLNIATLGNRPSSRGCTSQASTAPCDWLNIRSEIYGCKMVEKIVKIYNHVTNFCGDRFSIINDEKIESLIKLSASDNCNSEIYSGIQRTQAEDEFRGDSEKRAERMAEKLQRRNDEESAKANLAESRKKLELQLELEMEASIMGPTMMNDAPINTLEEIPEYESEYESDKIRHRPNYEDENICTITDLAENSEGIYASGMQKFDKYIREAAKNSPRGFSTRLALKVRDRYDALIQE